MVGEHLVREGVSHRAKQELVGGVVGDHLVSGSKPPEPNLEPADHPMLQEEGIFWKLGAYYASQEAAAGDHRTGRQGSRLSVGPSSSAILQSLKGG